MQKTNMDICHLVSDKNKTQDQEMKEELKLKAGEKREKYRGQTSRKES